MTLLVLILVGAGRLPRIFAHYGRSADAGDDPRVSRDRHILEIKTELKQLQQRVDQLEGENQRLERSNAGFKATSQPMQAKVAQATETLQSQVGAPPSPAFFAEEVDRYLGTYHFAVLGGPPANFIYDHKSNINTFALDLEPIILWQD
jgi:hypothetical protein